MRFRLRMLMILLAVGPPVVGLAWALRDNSASDRMPELALIAGAVLVFVSTLHPLMLAAAWTVDSTFALLGHFEKAEAREREAG